MTVSGDLEKDFFEQFIGYQVHNHIPVEVKWALKWMGERLKQEAIEMGGDITPNEIDQLIQELDTPTGS